ncbi:unnamed protein product [Lathyrus oleraceus]|uniref:Uncharacterized protein n=1 Tax=Pisum sativum TaxID=3888 RepID=A0A9D4WW11_PEA|nr:uncharacterized protein LOC127084622 [Pisum sativum]KAI5408798.1 hypothetical protein KIW84_054584 [Pisum sativum]
MFPRRLKDPKTGFHMLSSMRAKKYMNKIGVESEDYNFYKQIGKALLCTYTILGALWIYNGNSPMEWWRKKSPQLKEKFEQANLYPSDVESVKEFFAKGKMIGATLKGLIESDKDECGCEEIQRKKVDEEAQRMWLKMKNEVVAELREKGIDVE